MKIELKTDINFIKDTAKYLNKIGGWEAIENTIIFKHEAYFYLLISMIRDDANCGFNEKGIDKREEIFIKIFRRGEKRRF